MVWKYDIRDSWNMEILYLREWKYENIMSETAEKYLEFLSISSDTCMDISDKCCQYVGVELNWQLCVCVWGGGGVKVVYTHMWAHNTSLCANGKVAYVYLG